MRHAVRLLLPIIAAAGLLLVTALPASAGEPNADGMIKRQGDAAFRGDNIYNLNGEGQTRTVAAHRGDIITFRVRTQNDAPQSGDVGLVATAADALRVKYFLGTTDVTDDVVNDDGHIETLGFGEHFTLTLEVKVRASAPNGNFVVSMQAEDSGEDDTTRARIKVS